MRQLLKYKVEENPFEKLLLALRVLPSKSQYGRCEYSEKRKKFEDQRKQKLLMNRKEKINTSSGLSGFY